MIKKIIIGILLLSVVGAGGAALAYNAAQEENQSAVQTPDPLANGQGYASDQQTGRGFQGGSGGAQNVAQGSEGEPWEASGKIVAIDDYGFNLTTEMGETVYIELGPPDYWQSLDVSLEIGEEATVSGSINEDMIHATQVLLADGQVLDLRNETGQPLWSGGAANSRGGNDGQVSGEPLQGSQVQVDEWLTITGTLMSFQGANMTIGTPEGDLITFQTGQPRFFASQGVTFQVGDEIEVLGFYEGQQFMAGEITQVSTGLWVMLRNPNGRPLWAGPGNGNSNGNGNGNRRGGNF